jgi:hypothetical protein
MVFNSFIATHFSNEDNTRNSLIFLAWIKINIIPSEQILAA